MGTDFNPSIALATIPIYAIIFIGWLTRKIGWIHPESDRSFMRFAIDVSLPCFIFYNMIGNEKLASISYAVGAISLGAIGVGMCLTLCWVASKFLGLKIGEGQRTFVVTTGIHNYGFFIIALVVILYPNDENDFMGLVLTHNVGCDLVFWSLGVALLSPSVKFSPAILLKGPVLSVFVALFFIWTGLAGKIPDFALSSLKLLGGAAIPLNLFMFGTLIYDLFSRESFNAKIVGTAVLMRMALLPIAFILLATALPIDPSLKKLIAFQALSPCGVTAAVLAKHFGGYPQMAVQITIATLVVAPFTLPVWMWLGATLTGAF